MGEPDLQLRTTYVIPRFELVGQAGGALGSPTSRYEFATEGLAGVGGRFCVDILRTTSDGGPPHYPFNGWGGGACYTLLYNEDGGAQHRVSAGIRPFLLDGTLMVPVDLTYLYQDVPGGNPIHGGLLNAGIRWFFHRNLADGPGVNLYLGGDIGIGGIGGSNYGGLGAGGGFYAEIQGVFGAQFRLPGGL